MAGKPLSEALRPASFRGVAFQVEATDGSAGRRTQVHEYPQKDQPWTEDLGRATRGLSFEGFVVGPDYVDQAKRLIGALEEPGTGTLVHPWFGTMQVNVREDARYSFNSALGYARFSLSFVEAGELTFPNAGDSTQAQSRIAAQDIETASVNDFSKVFSVDGFQDFVTAAASGNLSSLTGVIGGGSVPGLEALGYADRAADTLTSALGLLSSPQSLGSLLARFVGITGYLNTGMRWSGLVRSLVRLSGHSGLAAPASPAVYTPSRQQAYANATALNALARQTILAQAVGASSLMPAAVHDETIGLRNDLTAALDAESLTASDAVYVALQDARGKVWKDLTERARDSARLTTLSPADTTPALVLAYDFYEDAGRDSDIVARNGIRHPGFVPPKPLKVLTR